MEDAATCNRLVEEVGRESLPEKIVQSLRHAIVSGSLRAGTRLVEADMAQQLGVSRSALREALRMLQLEGLVEAHHNRGTYVASISEHDLQEIYILRTLLESYAVEKVAEEATPEQIRQLEAVIGSILEAEKAGNARQVTEEDFRFHKMIWGMCGHQRLAQVLSSMESQIRMILAVHTELYEYWLQAISGHQEILDAIRSRRPVEARELMRHHLELSAAMMREFLHERVGVAETGHWPLTSG